MITKTVYSTSKLPDGKLVYIGYPMTMDLESHPSGGFFVPAGMTLIAPPSHQPNKVAVLNESTKEWSLADDYRGEYWYEKDGSIRFVSRIGDHVPSGVMTQDPPSEFHTTHNGTDWIIDASKYQKSVYAKRDEVIAAIDAKMIEKSKEPFKSNALGSEHEYESCQWYLSRCLEMARISGANREVISKPSGSAYSRIEHTKSQIESVFSDLDAYLEAHRDVSIYLKGEVKTAFQTTDPNDELASLKALEAIDVDGWKIP